MRREAAKRALRAAPLDPGDSDEPGAGRRIALAAYADYDDFLDRLPRYLGDVEQHHLVIELKRPSVAIGATELTQIQQYATVVEADERFDRQRTKWDFFLISNTLDQYAKKQVAQQNREQGELYRSDNLSVWVLTWSQIIQDARHR